VPELIISLSAQVTTTYVYGILGQRDCPARWILLKGVSIDRSLLQEEVGRFSAVFTHPFSFERPMEIGGIMAMSDINSHSALN
jgi:hypothetical protein